MAAIQVARASRNGQGPGAPAEARTVTAVVYGARVGSATASGARACGTKSCAPRGLAYSYGPWSTHRRRSKLPWPGGEGVSHSKLVARQGLRPTRRPANQLWKKLTTKKVCQASSRNAQIEMNSFRGCRWR